MSGMFQADPFVIIAVMVGLSLLPFLAMIATCYLKIVVVMSLIRNALGIQSIPPNMVINAMALILTFFVMSPVLSESWDTLKVEMAANTPEREFRTDVAARAAEPIRGWLKKQTGDRERAFFVNTAKHLWSKEGEEVEVDPDGYAILIPSFCVSELTKAFEIGFLIYLPFVAIDIIISNILLAMGMMMVSPVTISLPFKLLLFVLVNGWTMLIQGLVRGYML